MNIIDFFLMEQKRLHARMRESVSGLTSDEWNYVGQGKTNSIAFLVWHCARTEDGIFRSVLQGRPSLWQEGNWHERMGLPLHAQGTGMSTEESHAFRIADPALFMEYANKVWQGIEEYTASISDGGAELSERIVTVKPVGDMPAIVAMGRICISHCFTHYGEIAYILGELGKQGMSL